MFSPDWSRGKGTPCPRVGTTVELNRITRGAPPDPDIQLRVSVCNVCCDRTDPNCGPWAHPSLGLRPLPPGSKPIISSLKCQILVHASERTLFRSPIYSTGTSFFLGASVYRDYTRGTCRRKSGTGVRPLTRVGYVSDSPRTVRRTPPGECPLSDGLRSFCFTPVGAADEGRPAG